MAAASFFPFVALYFLSHPAVSALDNNNNNIKITCPESFRCGNSGPPLYFPFTNISNPQCGLCTVFCSDHEHPISFINFGSEEIFTITDILSRHSGYGRVTVVHDPEFTKRLGAGDCSGFRNFSLPDSPFISFTIPHNLTLFKCRKSSLPSPPAHDEYFNYTGCHDFDLYYKHPLDDHHNVSASADSFHGCDTIQLPLTSGPYKSKTESGENDDDLLKLLTGTYYIELQATEDCLKCHGRGGQCETTINKKFHCTAKKNGSNHKLIIIIGIGTTTSVAMIFLFYYIEWKHLSKKILCFANLEKIDDQNVEAFLKSFGSLVPKRYSYLEIKKITNYFKNKLGEGGFGSVYWGKTSDGLQVRIFQFGFSQGSTSFLSSSKAVRLAAS